MIRSFFFSKSKAFSKRAVNPFSVALFALASSGPICAKNLEYISSESHDCEGPLY
ncbi:hypothetical protein Plhal304r1_c022g0077601 [Plasmopara halstedii]